MEAKLDDLDVETASLELTASDRKQTNKQQSKYFTGKIKNQTNNNGKERRSTRLAGKEQINYVKLNTGEKSIENTGTSEVAKHIMEHGHNKADMELSILGYENNWTKRGIKEAINIRRYNPSLNADKGRYKLSQIWTDVIARETETLERINRYPHS